MVASALKIKVIILQDGSAFRFFGKYCNETVAVMVNHELSEFYQGVYGRPLSEPANLQEAQDILSAIRAQHGYLDNEDQTELQRTSASFQKKTSMVFSSTRKILAQFTKT